MESDGIEPTASACKAPILPLNYDPIPKTTQKDPATTKQTRKRLLKNFVVGNLPLYAFLKLEIALSANALRRETKQRQNKQAKSYMQVTSSVQSTTMRPPKKRRLEAEQNKERHHKTEKSDRFG